MAESGQNAEKQLRDITNCPICMSAFTDPRILPCIHTFCLECLKSTLEATKKYPGGNIPCPLCRKEFIVPEDGMNGVQKNFFMENLLEFKNALQMGSATINCDMCNLSNKGTSRQVTKATMRCIECQDYYCDSCVEIHQFQKVSKHHEMVQIGSDMKSETKRLVSKKFCTKHIEKPFDYYCAECQKIVCVSCFVESHKSHDCKDVTTVDEEFRQTIEKKARKTSAYINDMLLMRNSNEITRARLMEEIAGTEIKIHKRNQELKDLIDRHTKSLLDELSMIKSRHLKEMETSMEEIDRYCTIMKSFEAYCTELALKGSASDICSSVDKIIGRADDLKIDIEAFIGRPRQLEEVSFQATLLGDFLQNSNSNLVGNVKETTSQLEKCTIVVGIDEGATITEDVFKLNLQQPNEITAQEKIPTTMKIEAVAVVYDNTMYVSGIGAECNEIWKYNQTSGWLKCASLVKGRRRHMAAFIDEVMYICGGFVEFGEPLLDSVEAFQALSNECTAVGKLVHSVKLSGNCVPIRSSLYIFGGLGSYDYEVSHVQVYNTKENTCTLLLKPMPRPYCLMRAFILETSVILVGRYACFIFDIETETWQEREQFKSDVDHFGLVLENERVFVIGGGVWETIDWRCSDDVRYVPLQNIIDDEPIAWKIHGKLPKPSLVHACANMRF